MNLQSWVEESQRRGEEVVVILRNKTTGEEVELTMNPAFATGVSEERRHIKKEE